MQTIPTGAIAAAAGAFLRPDSEALPSRRRERSWDLCYNHFQSHPRPTEVMELSCLHLGYYLASWGMLRGSSWLFKNTNALHYEPVIEIIEEYNSDLSTWDVDSYLDASKYEVYNRAWMDLKAALLPSGGRGLTLVSKVMMGTWGCVPSFDSYFVRTFQNLATGRGERRAWSRANNMALEMLHHVYEEHIDEVEQVRVEHPVISMVTGLHTERLMPSAKVLDIYGFYSSWKT